LSFDAVPSLVVHILVIVDFSPMEDLHSLENWIQLAIDFEPIERLECPEITTKNGQI
jgi:hypothetical protein